MGSKYSPTVTLGVDLGGTKIEAALVDGKGQVVVSHRRSTAAALGAERVISDIAACVHDLRSANPGPVSGLGVGVAGQVDGQRGVVRFAPNLGWRDVPLRDWLQEALKLPVTVLNDVQAATLGEWRYGAGRGVDDLVSVFVGTGIGGGVVSGGRLVAGSKGAAGEVGHMTIVAGGRQCRCPNCGCVEAYAGGWAIAERAQEAVLSGEPGSEVLLSTAGSIDAITAATVSTTYRGGDTFSKNFVEETGRFLGAGLVGVVNTLNPHTLVLGGGVVAGIPDLLDIAEAHIRAHALPAAAAGLHLSRSSLEGFAVAIGAASQAAISAAAGTP